MRHELFEAINSCVDRMFFPDWYCDSVWARDPITPLCGRSSIHARTEGSSSQFRLMHVQSIKIRSRDTFVDVITSNSLCGVLCLIHHHQKGEFVGSNEFLLRSDVLVYLSYIIAERLSARQLVW